MPEAQDSTETKAYQALDAVAWQTWLEMRRMGTTMLICGVSRVLVTCMFLWFLLFFLLSAIDPREQDLHNQQGTPMFPTVFNVHRELDPQYYAPFLLASLVPFCLAWMPWPRARLPILDALLDSESPEAIGPLSLALHIDDMALRVEVVEALLRLLPRLSSEDMARIDEWQRANLYLVLDMRRAADDYALIMSLLQALKRVGDVEALPYVRRLADAPIRFNEQERVRAAAWQCLPDLERLAARRAEASRLVRPAAAPTTPLLRPAHNGDPVDPQILLRPGAAEE